VSTARQHHIFKRTDIVTQPQRASWLSASNFFGKKNRRSTRRPVSRRARLQIECLEGRTLPAVSVLGGFAGLAFDPSQGATPPDTQVAVGPTAVGEAVNTSLAFFNKSGGSLFQGSFASLFSPVRADAADANIMTDPSLHYDADSGRFVVTILDLDMTKNLAYLDLAISTNNHPAQASDFIATQINVTENASATSPNPGSRLWTDFDRYGTNAAAWVFTFNMFTFPIGTSSVFDHVQVLAVQKSTLLSSTPSIVTHTLDLSGWNGTNIVNENVSPVDMHGATASDPMYFVEETAYGGATSTQLRVLKVPDILHATAAGVQPFDITVPAYTSNPALDFVHPWNSGDTNANAPQLGSSDQMQTNDTRMLSAAWRRDSQGVEHLVCTQETGATLARARWYEIITSTATPTLRQSGELGAPGAASYFPSIDISPNDTIAVNYLESSSTEYMSMYVTGRTAGDPLNTMQTPVLVQAGLTGYTLGGLEPSPHRAGDFSGIGVDIDSSGNPLNSFWAANEYTGSNGFWATRITNLSVAPVPQGAAIQVLDGSNVVSNGTGSASLGSTFVGTGVTKTITVQNIGTQNLMLTTPITVPAGFSLASGFGTTTLAPGATTTFTIQLNASAPGSYSGTVSFGTNDPHNNPFTFSVSGTVTGVSIIDDSQPGFSTVGSWTFWTNQGYLGNLHEAVGRAGADIATWTFNNLLPGVYRVSTTWNPYSNRATNAPYTIIDTGTTLGTVLVNQQLAPSGFSDAGGTWQDLGNFQVGGNSLVVQLADAGNGNVEADAIRLQWVAPLPQGPVVRLLAGNSVVADGTGSVNFGSTFVGTAVTKPFTIQNLGTQNLVLTSPNSLPAGFSLAAGFGSTTVAPGASTTFTLQMNALTTGTYSGTVSFGTNDSNNNPFTFSINGTVSGVSIIDNSSPSGYSTVGNWTLYTNQGYLGNLEEAVGRTGTDVATWSFANLAAGQYRVSATWNPYSNRATNAPYTLLDGGTSLGTVLINQQNPPSSFSDAGGTWQDLGNFQIRNGMLTVQLADAGNGNVEADAIRLQWLAPLPQGPVAQVLDGTTAIANGTGSDNLGSTLVGIPLTKTFTIQNLGTQNLTLYAPITMPSGFSLVSGFGSSTLAPGGKTTFTVQLDAAAVGSYSGQVSFGTSDPNNMTYSFTVSGTVTNVSIIDDSQPGFSTVGSWLVYTGSGYLGNVHDGIGRNGADIASWTWSNLAPGQYRVSATWTPYSDRATNAPYTVMDGSTLLSSVSVNQQLAPAGFTDVGTQWQDLGTFQIRSGSLVVNLSDLANGNVIADAIRLQWLAPLPQGPVVQVSDAGTNIADNTGSDSFGTSFVGNAVTKTFTVTNIGTQNVALGGIITVPAGFTVTSGVGTATVAPGASTTFTVRMDATTPGSYSGQLSFGSNDPNNNPFNFTISGTVSAVKIIDDSSSSGFSTVGSWTLWTNQGYLGNIHEAVGHTGADIATWTFANLAPGQYKVSATWTAYTNRATNAPYTILDGTTALATVSVNQQAAPSGFTDAGGQWQDLGTFQIRNGTLYVQLSDLANGNVEADAIRIQWLGPLPPPPAGIQSGHPGAPGHHSTNEFTPIWLAIEVGGHHHHHHHHHRHHDGHHRSHDHDRSPETKHDRDSVRHAVKQRHHAVDAVFSRDWDDADGL
jgi:hypothetical protein